MMDRRDFLAAVLAVPECALAFGPEALAKAAALTRDAVSARLGASTACLAGLSLLDAIRELQRLGFGTLEIIAYTGARHSVGDIPGFAYESASASERDRVFAATRGFRHISAHLPFQDVRLFSSRVEDRRVALERLRRAMDGLAFLRGEMAVMHLGWPDKGLRFRDIWQPMIDTLRALGDHAGERKLKLGIETMQPDSVRDYSEIIVAAAHPQVGAVVDTGHIRGATDIGLPADRRDTDEARARFNDVLNTLVSAVGKNVLHVHVSDIRRADWVDHKEIGTGVIDFRRFFTTLRGIDYKGLFVLELEEPDTVGALRRSKAYVEKLI
jgi:sugar phosphate isomerase/epimerase